MTCSLQGQGLSQQDTSQLSPENNRTSSIDADLADQIHLVGWVHWVNVSSPETKRSHHHIITSSHHQPVRSIPSIHHHPAAKDTSHQPDIMDESPPQSSSSSAMGSGTTSTSSIHRRDKPRRPSPPSIERRSPALSDNTAIRDSSLAPPLAEFRINTSSPCIVSTLQPQQPAPTAIDPLMSDDSGSERGVKRRRRSSAFERCDEMRRMSMKRCNGGGSFSAGTGGSAATVDRAVEDQHRPHERDGTQHPMPTTNVTGSLVSSTSSSSTTSASASTSSLVLDLHATTLSSSPQPLPRPRTRPQPVFTCPFTSYTKDRQDQTQPHPLHCSEDHPHEICGRNRRNSSISSEYTRRDSGWSTAESRRGTLTSGFSSPSTSTWAVDTTLQHDKQELKPFPMDRLPRDILNLILDHVLKSPEFGHNGRWKDKQGQDEDKVQMVKALKVSRPVPSSRRRRFGRKGSDPG